MRILWMNRWRLFASRVSTIGKRIRCGNLSVCEHESSRPSKRFTIQTMTKLFDLHKAYTQPSIPISMYRSRSSRTSLNKRHHHLTIIQSTSATHNVNITTSPKMSYLAVPYPERGRGGQRGGNQRGFLRGPRGNPRSNGYNPRGGHGQENPNYSGNNYIQQQPRIPQGGFYDPNGIWRPNEQLDPYIHNNYNPQWPIPNKQGRDPNSQDDSQEDVPIPIDWMDPKVKLDLNVMIQELADIQAALNDLQADFNKERGKYLHLNDEKYALLGENNVLKHKNGELNKTLAGLREINNSLGKNVADFQR